MKRNRPGARISCGGSIISALILLITLSCTPVYDTEYQAFFAADVQRCLYILNGSAENLSGLDLDEGEIYNSLQTVGYYNSSSAVPNDIYQYGGRLYVILSGQNSIEAYDAGDSADDQLLDYLTDYRHYFKNGYNPMYFIPVDGTSWVFVSGYKTDEVQLVNLDDTQTVYSFIACFEEVDDSSFTHPEIQTTPTIKNATGDNKKRGSTSGSVYIDGSTGWLYVTNVRYDAGILLTEGDTLAEYNGSNVQAPGEFREATLSIFSFNASALTDGASESSINLQLVSEVNLEDFYYTAADGQYFPGNGLNPQSSFIHNGLLSIVCTGTNGGSASVFTDSEYLPYLSGSTTVRYEVDDEKPGTNPDDGIILVLDLSSPEVPVYAGHMDIGGSPVMFRESVDESGQTVYLAGVGGIQSFKYGNSFSGFSVLHSSDNMIIEAENSAYDYYSGLSYDENDDLLYISFFSEDRIVAVTPEGVSAGSWISGDGPGALLIYNKE